jgi:hypothetical protein
MITSDIIAAISVTIAGLSFVYGVFAWKWQYLATRRIELAETVLAKFYEAADVIRDVRSPYGNLYQDEGTSRQRAENEKPEETRALNQAHVLFERWNKRRELFAELQSLKYRYMAAFGKSALEPFKDLAGVRNDMVFAANQLGTYLWPRETRGTLSDRDAAEKRKYENIFWSPCDQAKDEVTQRVQRAVEKIEDLLQSELRSQLSWWRRSWQWCSGRFYNMPWREKVDAIPIAAHS